MGGIKSHGKGIQITFYWKGQRYRPTLGIKATPTNFKYATQLKGEIERAIALGNYTLEKYAQHFPTSRTAKFAPTKKSIPTFSELADKWQAASSHLSNGTMIKYLQALAFWREQIGTLPVDEIKYSKIAALANSQGWAAKNRNNMLIPLRQVLEVAKLDGEIDVNLANNIKNAKIQKKEPNPLTSGEVNSVLMYMRENYNEQIENYFEFSIFTGMRPSEIISLRWEDIDLASGIAKVQRARTFGVEHETKTYKTRNVELNRRAQAAIARQKPYTFHKDGYVFENPVTHKPYRDERPLRRTYWNPTIKALKLKKRKFYQTRHTYATLNIMAGANPMWVAKQLGHANMQMILTVYATWIEAADKSKECEKMEMVYFDVATNPPQNHENTS